MFELRQAGERTWYVEAPSRVGIVETADGVWLIDSGDRTALTDWLWQLLQQRGWTLRGILNTHAHADHIAGNRLLQQRSGCVILAQGAEAAIARRPELDSVTLYGAYPCRELRQPLFRAEPSAAVELSPALLPPELAVFPLPGHALDMVGVRTADGVVFPGDAVCSLHTLKRTPIPFLYNVRLFLESLDTLENMEARLFVPAHAESVADIRPLTEANRRAVWAARAWLLDALGEGASQETLLRRLFESYALPLNIGEYALVGSTLRGYLSWLEEDGAAEPCFIDGVLCWRAK